MRDKPEGEHCKDEQCRDEHKQRMKDAMDEIDVLKDVHLVLAPLRPTLYMIEIGCRAGNASPIQVQLIYEAMLRSCLPAELG